MSYKIKINCDACGDRIARPDEMFCITCIEARDSEILELKERIEKLEKEAIE